MTAQAIRDFNGMHCLWLSRDDLRLAVTVDRGPRIVFLALGDGPNLLAETPDVVLESPNGSLRLLGGHRLWYAPEIVERTYWPDDRAVAYDLEGESVRLVAPPDGVGVVKTLEITVSDAQAGVTLTHQLTNNSDETLTLAPWALTMVPLGGVTLLPQSTAPADAAGLLPNRQVIFWPYTDPGDPRLVWGKRMILVRGESGPANKLGYRNLVGWVAHWYAGILLVKRYDPQPESNHPDGDCNAECYIDHRFMEVESLGPLIHLAPGKQVQHIETWELHAGIAAITSEAEAVALATRLGLLTV